jgi:hypothetical protein
MRTATHRERISFGGVTFSGVAHAPNHITVPVPALIKLLRARAVAPHCCYDIERDGGGDRDNYHFDIERVAEWCDRELRMLAGHIRRPWLLYYDGQVIHYCPHSNLSYELREAPRQLSPGAVNRGNGSSVSGSRQFPSASSANVSAAGNASPPNCQARVQTSH